MTIMDIGTNMGETLLNFARLNPAGKNYGFEPVPFLYQKANHNISLNDFKNIFLNNIALSDQPGKLYFEIPKNRNYGSISMAKEASSNAQEVQAITLDEFVAVNKIEKIDLIKIDVEGFEVNVLKGASNTIHQHRPILYIEVVDSYLTSKGSSAKELLDMIRQHNYKIQNADTLEVIGADYSAYDIRMDIICTPVTSA
jgi:FkbM family methyltransferase